MKLYLFSIRGWEPIRCKVTSVLYSPIPIRKLMAERGMPFPPINRTVYSVCIVELCKERVPNGDPPQK